MGKAAQETEVIDNDTINENEIIQEGQTLEKANDSIKQEIVPDKKKS